MVCSFNLCSHCPYKDSDCYTFISDSGVETGFIQACKHQHGFMEYAMKINPDITKKFYYGV